MSLFLSENKCLQWNDEWNGDGVFEMLRSRLLLCLIVIGEERERTFDIEKHKSEQELISFNEVPREVLVKAIMHRWPS